MRSTSCAIIGTRRNFHSHVISFGETCVECAFACVTSCLSCVIIRFVITHFIITCIAPSFRRELRTSWRTWRVRRRHPPPVQQRRWTGTAGRRRSVSCRKLASGTSTSANDAMTWRRKTPNWRVACLSVSGGGGLCWMWMKNDGVIFGKRFRLFLAKRDFISVPAKIRLVLSSLRAAKFAITDTPQKNFRRSRACLHNPPHSALNSPKDDLLVI